MMATKKPAKKAPAKAGVDREIEIERLKDEIELPVSPQEEWVESEAFDAWTDRYLRRVRRWVAANSTESVAIELTRNLIKARLMSREMMNFCEVLAEDRATVKYQRKHARRGTGFRYWPDIKTEYLAFKSDPGRFDGSSGFKAAMEVKYGASPGTLANKMTEWDRE